MDVFGILGGIIVLLIYSFISDISKKLSKKAAYRVKGIHERIAIELAGFFIRLTFVGTAFFLFSRLFSKGFVSALLTFTVGFTLLLFIKTGKEFYISKLT